MVKLRQGNAKWAWKPIGKSKSTIGRYGCTITSIAMASDYFGCFRDPAWMAKNLNFLVDKVIWKSIEKVLCFKFLWRYYSRDDKAFAEALKNPKRVCLLNVMNGAHWVIATQKLPFGYWTVDPLTGKSTYYAKGIVGGAVLEKK
jgi:hypothetical protein